jgi:uncharacterized MAPEG superfamily protein
MLSDLTILVLSAILAFLMLGTASALRCQAYAAGGVRRATGNRDDLPEPTPLAGRADRAAKNMIENLVLFVALVTALHFVGKAGSTTAQIGANIFFWMRLAYWPVYLAGNRLRSIGLDGEHHRTRHDRVGRRHLTTPSA